MVEFYIDVLGRYDLATKLYEDAYLKLNSLLFETDEKFNPRCHLYRKVFFWFAMLNA